MREKSKIIHINDYWLLETETPSTWPALRHKKCNGIIAIKHFNGTRVHIERYHGVEDQECRCKLNKKSYENVISKAKFLLNL